MHGLHQLAVKSTTIGTFLLAPSFTRFSHSSIDSMLFRLSCGDLLAAEDMVAATGGRQLDKEVDRGGSEQTPLAQQEPPEAEG